MKAYCIIAIVLSGFFYSSALYSQDSGTETAHNSSSISIYFINGYALSYNFKNNSDTKFRIKIDFNSTYSNNNNNNESTVIKPDTTITKNVNGVISKDNSYTFTLTPQYFTPVFKSGFANIYAGAGPLFTYSYNKSTQSEPVTEDYRDPSYNNYELQKSYSLGIEGFLGLEGYITKNFSILAEVSVSGGRTWSNHEISWGSYYSLYDFYITRDKTDGKSWFVNVSSIKLGVMLYL